jgi:ABC-type uncharacterized transport system permease subunit
VPDIVIHVIASAAYVGLAWHFWSTRWRHPATPGSASRMAERVAILAVLGIHGALLYSEIFAAPELRFGFAQALAVMIWLAVLICWVEALFYRMEALYPAALLAAAVCAPLPAFYPGRVTPDSVSFEFRLHLIFGLLAYSLFIVATLHALLISRVERRLHGVHGDARGEPGTVLEGPLGGVPPLLSLEQLVFRLTAAAFTVLTLTFVIGVAYSEAFFGRALRFDHKTLFVVLSWLTFGLLLAGQLLYGWRGRTAFRWTVAGFVMLMLAYPGSRFVLEVILHRS